MASVAATLLPQWSMPTRLFASRWATVYTHLWKPQLMPSLAIALPGISLNLPTLDDIWESLLRAVPKKKPSHSRRRHRQMAGKALPEVTGLCQCPGCGNTKKTHRLCSICHEGEWAARSSSSLPLTAQLDMKRIWHEDENNARKAGEERAAGA